MTDQRLIRAIGRLESAVATLESRLAAPRPTALPDDAGATRALADLEGRHAILRDRAAAAIARLDGLIHAGGER